MRYLVEEASLIKLADNIRAITNTENLYTLEEMNTALNNLNTQYSSLINYNVEFTLRNSNALIVVMYSQWTNDGIKIITEEISGTGTLNILQNSSFTIMGVDGTYVLSGLTCSENISDIRSIQSTVYYSYCLSCNGDGTIVFNF